MRMQKPLVIRGGRSWQNANAATFLIEMHGAIHQGEQGEILTLANMLAGAKTIAYLPHQDIACDNRLAAKSLHAATLAFRIPTVTR